MFEIIPALCYFVTGICTRINRIAVREARVAKQNEAAALREKTGAKKARDELDMKNRLVEFISQELKLGRDGLEARVAERTHELPEANEKLKEIDHLKSAFIAIISHEIRTPLTMILDYEKILSRRTTEIEGELDIARLIHARLMPDPYHRDSQFNIWATFIPMDKVGGDFYDYRDDGRRLDFFIADVSGHGIPGALLAVVTRLALGNAAREWDSTDRILYRLNSVISDYAERNNFVTSFYCSIDKASRIMRYSSAGHCPAILYRPSAKRLTELHACGRARGWSGDIILEEKSLNWSRGTGSFSSRTESSSAGTAAASCTGSTGSGSSSWGTTGFLRKSCPRSCSMTSSASPARRPSTTTLRSSSSTCSEPMRGEGMTG